MNTMQNIRVIPCLDVKGGRVVKGIQFIDLRDAGDPAEMGAIYEREGADELVFLDITATTEDRSTTLDAIARTCANITIPLTVGGGMRNIRDVQRVLDAGASRVSINSAAVATPALIDDVVATFGAERLTIAIDARRREDGNGYEVVTHGGKTRTGIDPVIWARECEQRGAAEILLTSMDRDGTLDGYDLGLTQAVSDAVSIPVVASGGAGTLQHFADGVTEGGASAVLAASLFHFGTYRVQEVKDFLAGYTPSDVAS